MVQIWSGFDCWRCILFPWTFYFVGALLETEMRRFCNDIVKGAYTIFGVGEAYRNIEASVRNKRYESEPSFICIVNISE